MRIKSFRMLKRYAAVTCIIPVVLTVLLVVTGSSIAAEVLKVGILTPLSKTYAPIGQQVRWGIELAAKQINAQGGIAGRQVELIFEDSEANPAVATQKAEKLFQKDNVDFLTGTVNSGATLAVGQIAERNNKLIATTVSISGKITGSGCSPNVFRVNAHAGMQANALANWLAGQQPGGQVYYIGPDYEMGRNAVASFRKQAELNKLKSVGEVFAPLGNNDYSPYFGKIRSSRPDILYTSVAGNDTVRLFSQLNEYNMLKKLLVIGASVSVTSQNITAMGNNAENFVTVSGYSPELDTPANKTFVSDFNAAYQSNPDLYGADSYGLLWLYKAAVEKAGSSSTEAVREALEGLTWDTPQGQKIMRAEDHQAQADLFVVKVKGGKFVILDGVAGDIAIGKDTCKHF